MPKVNKQPKYWGDRAIQVSVNAEKDALQVSARVRKASKSVISRVNAEIELFYKKYAIDNSMSLVDARKRLTPFEANEFRDEQQAFASKMESRSADWFGDNSKSATNSRKQAERLSRRLYITRLEALKQNILNHVDELAVDYEFDLGKQMSRTMEESFNATMYTIQKGARVGFDFTQPGDKLLRQACKTKHYGENYSSSIWKDRNVLATQLDTLLPREFVSGQGSKKVARELKHRLEIMYGRPVKQSHAERLIRTEINYIANQGTMNAYKETGFLDKYEYLATLDKRTSQVCAGLDESIFANEDAAVGVNLPPMHSNCRSTTIPYFEDDDISSSVDDRVHRDDEGKSVKLGKDMNYKDWSKEYAPEFYNKYFVNSTTKPRDPEPTQDVVVA